MLPEVPKAKGTEFIAEALEMLSLYSRDSLERHLGSARCVFNHESLLQNWRSSKEHVTDRMCTVSRETPTFCEFMLQS